MDVEQLNKVLAGIPHMTAQQGRTITEFIQTHDLHRCLELGFAHGVGTSYMANAVRGFSDGLVVAIDLEAARGRDPNIETTLRLAEVDPARIEIHFEPLSYNWRQMKFIEEGRGGCFDFVYIDGAHTWEADGLAFYLSAKLLRPGGWMLFDDLNWTLESPTLQDADWVKAIPADVRHTAQVRKIWELLVKTDPQFDQFLEYDDWAFAHKRLETGSEKVIVRYHPLATSLLEVKHLARRARNRLARRGAKRGRQIGGME